jgi:hypothetical protein
MTPSKKHAECPHLSGGLKPTTLGYSHIAFLLLSILDPLSVSLPLLRRRLGLSLSLSLCACETSKEEEKKDSRRIWRRKTGGGYGERRKRREEKENWEQVVTVEGRGGGPCC